MPAFYTLAIVWIYRDLWHQGAAATGLGWDTIDTHGPDLDFFSTEIREGRFSLWNPYDKGGYPVFCDPVFDRYYPFNWPFAWFGALFSSCSCSSLVLPFGIRQDAGAPAAGETNIGMSKLIGAKSASEGRARQNRARRSVQPFNSIRLTPYI